MALTGKKLNLIDAFNFLQDSLAAKYETRVVGEQKAFYADNGKYFRPFSIKEWDVVGIEYAHSEEEARKNFFDDGDLFPMEEYTEENKDALLKDILQEIED